MPRKLCAGRRTYSMTEQERIALALSGFKKGIITYGEYLGVCAEVIQAYEQKQDVETLWDYTPEYKALCVISPNLFH